MDQPPSRRSIRACVCFFLIVSWIASQASSTTLALAKPSPTRVTFNIWYQDLPFEITLENSREVPTVQTVLRRDLLWKSAATALASFPPGQRRQVSPELFIAVTTAVERTLRWHAKNNPTLVFKPLRIAMMSDSIHDECVIEGDLPNEDVCFSFVDTKADWSYINATFEELYKHM